MWVGNSHARCRAGENLETISKDYLLLYFLLFHESKKYLQECLIKLQNFLKKEKLELNKKTRIYSNNENFIFLGRKNSKNYANYRRIKGKIKKKYYLFQKEKTSLYSLMSSINSFYTLDKKYTEKCLEKFR